MTEIGAFWLKNGKSGKFMSGSIKQTIPAGASVLLFKNDKGDNERRADYKLYLAEDRQQQGQQRAGFQQNRPSQPQGQQYGSEDDFSNDIPF